jgi:hypothetical protein
MARMLPPDDDQYLRPGLRQDVRACTGAGRHRASGDGTTGRDAGRAVVTHDAPMIERIGRRLRTVLDRDAGPSDLGGVDRAAAAGPPLPSGPLIEFVAYGEDCLLAGRLRLGPDRLTDLLNAQEEYEIVDLVAERLSDGRSTSIPALRVPRHDLLLVQAAGPRGDAGRRHRTRPYPVAAKVGPYRVRGLLHAMPGVDPEVVIHRRDPMVPLTDAWVERPVGDERDLYPIGTVVLNRDRMDWVMATWDDSSDWLDADLPDAGHALPAT